ncbi:uncharacterized protein N7459_000250 [Penicillium hispanicum]|uniref:uncharacterized protein n=1 Tax=Penicillium hispanicum TaxID=1080232 RepID=UPI0025421AFC|nr:uncharacterized protein N7459_000250 [Penicillium hispanicum]KAJ5594042.1 hypothetical protein N7459_000250 [Penicillium hispanicum]
MSKVSKVNHAAGIFADMSVDGPAIGTLVAIIDRAKNLPNRKTMGKQNPYCAARLGKEAKKTQTDLRGGQTPRWDHELRFTVHESPDYYKLKVSVFNDDKKTDLIGETWVDLQNLIIPGGSQNDHWHPLQCRGKYSGEIRIEMTYYDTREQDEAIIERRKEAAERVQGKPIVSSSSGLSGPRQLNAVKRRPLPSDPSGVTSTRPHPPEQVHSAPPLHHPMPSRPPMRDHVHTMPPAPDPETLPYPPRHSEPTYETPAYDAPDNRHREWEAPAPAEKMRRNTHETPYPSHDDPEPSYDPRPHQPRSHSDYEYSHPDFGPASQDPPYEPYMRGRAPSYDPGPQPSDIYSPLSPQYTANPAAFGPVSTFTPRQSARVDEPAPLSFSRPSSSSGPAETPRYQPHNTRALRALPPSSDYHPEYATMQPRVEDEEEDGPPPPPPVHRSRRAQQVPPAHPPTNQSGSPYTPYSPGYSSNASSMPASLVAGYETDNQTDRSVLEHSHRRRRSSHFDDEMMITQPPLSAPVSAPVLASMPQQASLPAPYESPIYPLRTSPQPIDDRPASSHSRGGSTSPDTRMVTRKSISPRPSSSSDRGNPSIPFSPDSYNSLNPHASRSVPGRDHMSAYEAPYQARDATVRPEIESIRDPDQPIIGDDGREIDPSDHLPTETWAPEPEKKNRKPEVIIRFKHSPRPTSRGNDTSPRPSGPPRVGFKTAEPVSYSMDRSRQRYTPSHVHSSTDAVVRTPPRGNDSYGTYSPARGYNTPTSADRPRSSHRGSVSPSPSSRSPLYDYSPGPPIPSKVPISQGPPSYPVTASNPSSGNPGMDALSRELKTIDIGSVGCSPSRAVRKYAARPPATMGYAS